MGHYNPICACFDSQLSQGWCDLFDAVEPLVEQGADERFFFFQEVAGAVEDDAGGTRVVLRQPPGIFIADRGILPAGDDQCRFGEGFVEGVDIEAAVIGAVVVSFLRRTASAGGRSRVLEGGAPGVPGNWGIELGME